MSEMWFPSGDLGGNNRSSNVFPTHWWGGAHEASGDDEDTEDSEEFVLTMDAIVNLFRIISVCPAESLGMVLSSEELDLDEDELTRMVVWCDDLAEQISEALYDE